MEYYYRDHTRASNATMPRYAFIGIVFENIVHGIGTALCG